MKRCISLLLAAVLLCGLLPPAAAAGADAAVSGDASRVSLALLQDLAGMADDEFVSVSIYLRGPALEEIRAQVPVPEPGENATAEERDAYEQARYQTQQSMHRALTDAFAQAYLDESAEVLGTVLDRPPGLRCRVRKSALPALTQPGEVLWITRSSTGVYLVEETAAEDKYTGPLKEYLQDAPEDGRVTVRLWLRGPGEEEAALLTGIGRPDFSTTAEAFAAYVSASQEASAEQYMDPCGVFAQNHLGQDDEILYQGRSGRVPVMVVRVPVSRLGTLAGQRAVTQVDPAFGYEEAFPDPELPGDSAALNKLSPSLREFMTIAGHDEKIPVSFDLKGPKDEELAALDREDLRKTYVSLTTAFVQDHLDDGDEVLFRSNYTPSVWAIVPKYKIAALAGLDVVSQLGWIPGYNDPVYGEGQEAVYVKAAAPAPPDDPDYLDKLDSYLLKQMEGKADDEVIPISLHLAAPSPEEIEAMLPVSRPDVSPAVTLEEIDSYISAKRELAREIYSAITDAFVREHLDENDTVRYRGRYTSTVICSVPRAKVFALAALEEVTQIVWASKSPVYPTWIRDESEAAAKLTEPLTECLETAADDDPVPVIVDLHMPSGEIMERIVPVPKPAEDAGQEEIDAYNAAYLETWRQQVSLRTDAFVNGTLNDTEPVYYVGQDAATVVCEVSAWRVRDLASRQEIIRIGLAGGVPEGPAPVDTAALDLALFQAQSVDLSRYTEESAAALLAAIEAAEAILAKEGLGQEEADAAVKALEDAMAALTAQGDTQDFLFLDVMDCTCYWFEPVYWACRRQPPITNGMDPRHFGPEEACTRAHVVTFLWRAANCPEPESTQTPFTDLKPGAFYEKAVAWAVENGITEGTSATAFSPDAVCTRGQIVTFLWRFRGSPAPERTETPFRDLKAGAFYEKAVAWAVENEVTNGMTAAAFAPQDTCTRGQVVTFLYRAAE